MLRLSIPKMKCGGCVDAVTAALRKLDADGPIHVDLEHKQVDYGGAADAEAVRAALAAAGYPAA